MMLAHFAPVNWAKTLASSKPTKRMEFYDVQHGDTLAGIALRHNVHEAELRAMNNLLSGSAIFCGQKLRVRRKQRSQSLPVLPFADRIDQEETVDTNDADNNSNSSSNNNSNNVYDSHEQDEQQPEASPDPNRSKFPAPCRTASLHHDDTSGDKRAQSTQLTRRQQRSKSERLHTHLEEDEVSVPRLLGGSASEVLSDSRYCAKLVPKLEASLSMRFRGYDWQLLYSLAQHGSSLHTLLRLARGKCPTLVVIETTRSEVFGGFVTVPWSQSKSYYGTGESFVFTCQPRYERFPWSRKNAMFMLSTDRGIGMGGGGGFAWFANSDLSRGSSAPSDTFANRQLTVESDFEIACVEVWGFITKR